MYCKEDCIIKEAFRNHLQVSLMNLLVADMKICTLDFLYTTAFHTIPCYLVASILLYSQEILKFFHTMKWVFRYFGRSMPF